MKSYLVKIKLVVKCYIFISFLFLNMLCSSNFIQLDDLRYLEKEDKKKFILRCKKDKYFIENSKCLNYLAIKIYLNQYNLKNKKKISDEDFENIEVKCISLLRSAIKSGSKDAIINLAWILSNESTNFKDLKKSSDLYIKYYNFKEKEKIKTITAKNKENLISLTPNYSNIELALNLIEQIKTYRQFSNQKQVYITEIEWAYAQVLLTDIINGSKINKKTLESLRKKVIKDSAIIIDLLTFELKNQDEKLINDAKKSFTKLKEISKSFN